MSEKHARRIADEMQALGVVAQAALRIHPDGNEWVVVWGTVHQTTLGAIHSEREYVEWREDFDGGVMRYLMCPECKTSYSADSELYQRYMPGAAFRCGHCETASLLQLWEVQGGQHALVAESVDIEYLKRAGGASIYQPLQQSTLPEPEREVNYVDVLMRAGFTPWRKRNGTIVWAHDRETAEHLVGSKLSATVASHVDESDIIVMDGQDMPSGYYVAADPMSGYSTAGTVYTIGFRKIGKKQEGAA